MHPNGRQFSESFGTQSGRFSREKTHCDRGHEFTEENTRWVRRKSRNPDFPDRWSRACRKCALEDGKAYRDRQRIIKAYLEVTAEAEG